jgi:hypothetical protein
MINFDELKDRISVEINLKSVRLTSNRCPTRVFHAQFSFSNVVAFYYFKRSHSERASEVRFLMPSNPRHAF